MLEEARSAPRSVRALLEADTEGYRALATLMRSAPPAGIVTIARGSSDHAATYLAYLLTARTGRLVASLPLSLVTLYHAPLVADRLLAIAISQSGRSPDLVEPIHKLRQGGATTVALVNEETSPLAQAAEWLLPLHAGPERSVAATKSFICSLAAGARLAAEWSESQDLIRALRELPASLECARDMDWSAVVPRLATSERLMVIARGIGLSIAQEAALKFKETCGIQAEAFSAAEIQHGPQALVSEGYPLLAFALRGPTQPGILALVSDMRRRGADVILAAPSDVPERDLTLATTLSEDLDPIAAIQSFYPLIEAVSRTRGRNPDQPPFLNKVTSTH
jgi:glucosamine--fructose-6-phosphate aminotransferase (isomerizing)